MAALDLNLLRVLDALLRERHLTRAARKLGLSQPATSHALARLREHLGDPLFVRTQAGLVPTPRAAALEPGLRSALAALSSCIAGEERFEPRTAAMTFTLSTADYGAFVLVPPLLERLTEEAPSVDLWVRAPKDDPYAELTRGDADVYVGPVPAASPPAGIHLTPMYDEHFVCVVRKDHPRVRRKLDLDTYASLGHVFVAPRGTPGGVVDDVLARHGRRRRVAIGVPQFLLAPHLLSRSDMILTIGRRIAEAFAKLLPLRIVEPPVTLPPFVMNLVWHERTAGDPAHAWFRERIARSMKVRSTTR